MFRVRLDSALGLKATARLGVASFHEVEVSACYLATVAKAVQQRLLLAARKPVPSRESGHSQSAKSPADHGLNTFGHFLLHGAYYALGASCASGKRDRFIPPVSSGASERGPDKCRQAAVLGGNPPGCRASDAR